MRMRIWLLLLVSERVSHFVHRLIRSTFAKKCTERTILVHRTRLKEGQTVVSLRVGLPLKTTRLEIFIWAKNRWHGVVFRTEGITPFFLGKFRWVKRSMISPEIYGNQQRYIVDLVFSYSRGSESRFWDPTAHKSGDFCVNRPELKQELSRSYAMNMTQPFPASWCMNILLHLPKWICCPDSSSSENNGIVWLFGSHKALTKRPPQRKTFKATEVYQQQHHIYPIQNNWSLSPKSPKHLAFKQRSKSGAPWQTNLPEGWIEAGGMKVLMTRPVRLLELQKLGGWVVTGHQVPAIFGCDQTWCKCCKRHFEGILSDKNSAWSLGW